MATDTQEAVTVASVLRASFCNIDRIVKADKHVKHESYHWFPNHKIK